VQFRDCIRHFAGESRLQRGAAEDLELVYVVAEDLVDHHLPADLRDGGPGRVLAQQEELEPVEREDVQTVEALDPRIAQDRPFRLVRGLLGHEEQQRPVRRLLQRIGDRANTMARLACPTSPQNELNRHRNVPLAFLLLSDHPFKMAPFHPSIELQQAASHGRIKPSDIGYLASVVLSWQDVIFHK